MCVCLLKAFFIHFTLLNVKEVKLFHAVGAHWDKRRTVPQSQEFLNLEFKRGAIFFEIWKQSKKQLQSEFNFGFKRIRMGQHIYLNILWRQICRQIPLSTLPECRTVKVLTQSHEMKVVTDRFCVRKVLVCLFLSLL